MTDDASPENLRKFLESDDPAMVRMGLSMAKGSGVPEELLGLVAGLYMHEDNSIRESAKSVFMNFASDEPIAKEEFISLIDSLSDESFEVREAAAETLLKTGDIQSLVPLINFTRINLRDTKSAFFGIPTAGEYTSRFPGPVRASRAGQGEELTVSELKTILKEKELTTSGTKTLLIQRIMDAGIAFESGFTENLALGIKQMCGNLPNKDVEQLIDDLYDVWGKAGYYGGIANWDDGVDEDMWVDIDFDSGPHCAIVKIIAILEDSNLVSVHPIYGKRMEHIIWDIREIVGKYSREYTEGYELYEQWYFVTCSIYLLGWIHWEFDLISEPEKDREILYPYLAGRWDDGTLFWPDAIEFDEFEGELPNQLREGELTVSEAAISIGATFADEDIIAAAEDALHSLSGRIVGGDGDFYAPL